MGLSGFQKPESRKNLEKSHASPFKRLSRTRKLFKRDHWIVPELKQFVTQTTKHNKNLVFLMDDIALQYTVKACFAYTNKSCSPSSFSSLPMKACESEVYNKHCSALGHALHIALVLICL